MFELTLALVVFLLPLAWSPGPGNSVFAAIGARSGLRATAAPSLGYHLATWVVTLALGFGFFEVQARMPQLFEAIRLAGAAWVLWIAWKFWRAGAQGAGGGAVRATALDGAVLLLLNPKAYLIIALMFSQFLPAGQPGEALLVLWIASVFTLNNLVAFIGWSVLGDRLGRLFRTPAQARALNAVFALSLVAVAIWMLLR